MNYEVIADIEELQRFVEWLPTEKEDEVYYVCLMARSKYATKPVVGWNTKSDEKQLARFLTTKDRLIEKLMKLEVEEGVYMRRGEAIPQETLAAYITTNPRNMRKGSIDLMHTLVDSMAQGTHLNPVETALTAVHKARGTRYVTDFDFDGDDSKPSDLMQYINPSAVTIVSTRGGFHALVRPDLVHHDFKNTWHKNISAMPGVDGTGDKMLPIPGTFQGGAIPRISRW